MSLPETRLGLNNSSRTSKVYGEYHFFPQSRVPGFNDTLILNQIFDAQFLQLLTGEDMLSSTWATESSSPEFPLDPNNGPESFTAEEDSHKSYCLDTPFFDDAIILTVGVDSEDEEDT